MIALREDLPLLRVGEVEIVTYDESWLADQLQAAAAALGEPDWPGARDVAGGIITHLRHDFPASAVTLGFVRYQLRSALQALGYHALAAACKLRPPEVPVDLRELARQAEGLFLRFLPLLRTRLAGLERAGALEIACARARAASLALAGGKAWNRRSAATLAEITAAIQAWAPGARLVDE